MCTKSEVQPYADELISYCGSKMGFKKPPRIFFQEDEKNAMNPLGRTAHYDPVNKSITVFITGRHVKDVLRSIAHELVHHVQNLRGDLSPDKCGTEDPNYAQNNPHLRSMEKEAYKVGNITFRDWENTRDLNQTKENINMATEENKNKLKSIIKKIMLEYYKRDEKDSKVTEGETVEEEREVFSANHYCIHHGGVHHNGSIAMAEAVQHTAPDENNFISHYDMKLADGTILENVPAEDIQVTNASLATEHMNKRDDHKAYKKKKMQEEELEEVKSHDDIPRSKKEAEDADMHGHTDDEKKKKGDGNKKTDKYDDNPKLKGKQASNLPDDLQKAIIGANESKILTPEHEQELYESRFANRNNNLFERLLNKWTK